jgi:hypothetical protein
MKGRSAEDGAASGRGSASLGFMDKLGILSYTLLISLLLILGGMELWTFLTTSSEIRINKRPSITILDLARLELRAGPVSVKLWIRKV